MILDVSAISNLIRCLYKTNNLDKKIIFLRNTIFDRNYFLVRLSINYFKVNYRLNTWRIRKCDDWDFKIDPNLKLCWKMA